MFGHDKRKFGCQEKSLVAAKESLFVEQKKVWSLHIMNLVTKEVCGDTCGPP